MGIFRIRGHSMKISGVLVSRLANIVIVIKCLKDNFDFFYGIPKLNAYGDITFAGDGEIWAYARYMYLRPFNKEGSLSCNACCDTGHHIIRFHPTDRLI